jgi:signal peptidase II
MNNTGENQAEFLDDTTETEAINDQEEPVFTADEIVEAESAEEHEETDSTAGEAGRSRVWERGLLFLIAGGVIFLDQSSKNLVETTLELYTYWAPFPELENIFRITHISNTGVAFGLFQDGNTIFTILAIVVSIGIIIYNSRLDGGHKLLRLALGLQMGGALGNMIDRVRQGHVTDFMDFGPWPIWNVADLAIVSGTILLVLIMFYDERQEKKLAVAADADEEPTKPSLEIAAPRVEDVSTS